MARLLGSLTMAVSLLVAIAAALGWGTIYETIFGTAAVQRFVYRSWWFQGLLAFLGLNLAIAAFERFPWQRRHLPFLLAHLGIILILLGGIIGGRLGVEGQLIIPEGHATKTLRLPGNVLVVHQPNPGFHAIFPTHFETTAWIHEPNVAFAVKTEGRTVQLLVDRYYPNAVVKAEVVDGGAEENPAIRLALTDSPAALSHPLQGNLPAASGGMPAASGGMPAGQAEAPAASGGMPAASGGLPAASGGLPAASGGMPATPVTGQIGEAWLFSRDPERFGVRWAGAHLLFLEPATEEELAWLMGSPAAEAGSPAAEAGSPAADAGSPTAEAGSPAASVYMGNPAADRGNPIAKKEGRGVIFVQFPDHPKVHRVEVPKKMNWPLTIPGTPYRITFKDYFSDFALTGEGPVNRSDRLNNPAVALTLTGSEGTEAHLLFALHPDLHAIHAFHPTASSFHGRPQKIPVRLRYAHPLGLVLPPDSIALVRIPSGKLAAVLTGKEGQRRRIEPVEVGQSYTHPWLGIAFEVTALLPRAQRNLKITNRDNEVKAQMLHLVGREGSQAAEVWLSLGDTQELRLGLHPILVEYRPGERELPLTVKLLDFRRIDYPGTSLAEGFESDVELTDPRAGLTLRRTIRMNAPLKYRGFTLFQSSYIQGPVETTVLSVRNDPGTPFVYAGFLIVVVGIVALFLFPREFPRE